MNTEKNFKILLIFKNATNFRSEVVIKKIIYLKSDLSVIIIKTK